LNKTRKDDKFGIILDCRYYIKKIHNQSCTNIQEGDEVIKVIFDFYRLEKKENEFVD
jgi:predicted DNA-binding helix-hairpin-helix protein